MSTFILHYSLCYPQIDKIIILWGIINSYSSHRVIIYFQLSKATFQYKIFFSCWGLRDIFHILWNNLSCRTLTHWGRDKMEAILADDIFKCIFMNENVWIPIKISLKFVPKGPINNIPASVQIMAWHRPGDKPLSEPMMVSLTTHICVTRPQWVKDSVSLLLQYMIKPTFE